MRIIKFSRGYIPAVIASSALLLFGIIGYAIFGFNLGVDFQAGINETVQLAYPTMELAYAGQGNAVLSVSETKATIVFSGADIQGKTVDIDFKSATTLGQVAAALKAIPDVSANLLESESLASTLLWERRLS
jgi:preprotein translocase subunit SecF